MNEIEVNNCTRGAVSKEFLRSVAEKVLRGERKAGAGVSIALVGTKKAAELNKKYRNKDRAANVLSFALPEFGLGEIVLCPQEVRKDAKKHGMIFSEALAWMFIHGLLHLLGYGHEKEEDAKRMVRKERFYLKLISNS